ncbi:hypothetical protein Msi02_34940 [Microbispora siamensis]|uniref:Uncharacterized protein n=1 Tax=Microbispora siamensis TaxID=564413 RepID=A0ABQ4GML6_9ACTN|nr:hypothetical protein Msi02_34940 [Microbispora siamensis]
MLETGKFLYGSPQELDRTAEERNRGGTPHRHKGNSAAARALPDMSLQVRKEESPCPDVRG